MAESLFLLPVHDKWNFDLCSLLYHFSATMEKIRMLIRYMNNNQHILYSLLIASLYAIYDVPAIMICHRHTKNNNKWFGKSQSYFMYFSRSRSSYVTKNWKHFSWHILFSLYIEWGQRCFSHSKSKAQRPVFNHSET